MNDRVRGIRDGVAAGSMMGGALGTLLQGLTFTIQGGRKLIIIRKTAVIVPRVIRFSGTAIGTLVGAVVGAHVSKAESRI